MIRHMDDIHTRKEAIFNDITERARAHRVSPAPFSNKLSAVQQELRKRRMDFLGSSVQLTNILWKNNELDMEYVAVLTDYLSLRTVDYWERPYERPYGFCRSFYGISLIALAAPPENNACLDDVIVLANCLVHDGKTAFTETLRSLLPESYCARLAHFADSIPSEFCDASFEDAVLGGVAALLGVLKTYQPNQTRRRTNEN